MAEENNCVFVIREAEKTLRALGPPRRSFFFISEPFAVLGPGGVEQLCETSSGVIPGYLRAGNESTRAVKFSK